MKAHAVVASGPSKVVGVAKSSLNLTGFIQFRFFFWRLCVSRIFFFFHNAVLKFLFFVQG